MQEAEYLMSPLAGWHSLLRVRGAMTLQGMNVLPYGSTLAVNRLRGFPRLQTVMLNAVCADSRQHRCSMC